MNWENRIATREHYSRVDHLIRSTSRNDWAVDPYAWDGVIRLTPIEAWLWSDIRAVGAVFYPQYPVGNLFVDFANPVARVAIECDGKEWHKDKERDKLRDEKLERIGWTVHHISGVDCRSDFDEETRTPSAARRFIERIAKQYGLIFE
jgi:very-short-patch-repair endonuclease